MANIRHPFIPTLDGEPLESETDATGRHRFTKKDGTVLSAEREEDVLFVNTALEDHWWDASGLTGLEGMCFDDDTMVPVEVSGEVIERTDVEEMLKALAADHLAPSTPASDVALDAAFFHRALMAFIDGDHEEHAPLPFSFWKAEIQELDAPPSIPAGATAYFATVYADANDTPHSAQYWVKDRLGGWLGAPLAYHEADDEASGRVISAPLDLGLLFAE